MMATSSDDGFDDNELQDDVDIDGDIDADGDAEGDLEEELMEELNEEMGSDDVCIFMCKPTTKADLKARIPLAIVTMTRMLMEMKTSHRDHHHHCQCPWTWIPDQTLRIYRLIMTWTLVRDKDAFDARYIYSYLCAAPSPPRARRRSNSPSTARRRTLLFPLGPNAPPFRTCVVEAVAALPHPAPIHSLASSACMTHLITGADDGYIRDYDIFPSLNGKNHLTAPQRHHAGVVEGVLKAVQIRYWWENPMIQKPESPEDDPSLSPVYALAMQSDALWALAGNDVRTSIRPPILWSYSSLQTGAINLFTVRHEPGRLCHTMQAGQNTITALALDHDEKAFFSAGGDGDAIVCTSSTSFQISADVFIALGFEHRTTGTRV